MDKPQVDAIRGIPPAIAIEQQNAVKTTRSTVGTITEINDYLKLLFPRLAKGHDPVTGEEIFTRHAGVDPAEIGGAFWIRQGAPHPLRDRRAVRHEGGGFLRLSPATGIPPRLALRQTLSGRRPDRLRTQGPARPCRDHPGRIDPARKTRFLEAVERALDLGKASSPSSIPIRGNGSNAPATGPRPRPARC